MNYFSAVKQAAFAQKLLAAAGLDFEAAFKAGAVDALKDKLAQIAADAKQEAAAGSADAKELQAALDGALAENKATVAKFEALRDAVAAKAGIAADAATPEAVTAAIEARASTKARELLAATGAAPLGETVVADAAIAAAKAKQPELKGRERTIAAFKAQAAAKAAK